MSIYRDLRVLVRDGATPDEAADRVLGSVAKAQLAALVRPLLVLEANRVARSLVRGIEREMDDRIAHGEDPISVRRKLSAETFALPNGTRVAWLDATAADHRARARWQMKLAGACSADADRHLAAALAIEAAGASCLREIESAA